MYTANPIVAWLFKPFTHFLQPYNWAHIGVFQSCDALSCNPQTDSIHGLALIVSLLGEDAGGVTPIAVILHDKGRFQITILEMRSFKEWCRSCMACDLQNGMTVCEWYVYAHVCVYTYIPLHDRQKANLPDTTHNSRSSFCSLSYMGQTKRNYERNIQSECINTTPQNQCCTCRQNKVCFQVRYQW